MFLNDLDYWDLNVFVVFIVWEYSEVKISDSEYDIWFSSFIEICIVLFVIVYWVNYEID